MTISPDKIADLRVKELEMIQAVIARLGSYGATLKNYCITLAVAVCGFAFTAGRPLAGLFALLPVFVCALLDAQYLRTERRFRGLFHDVRNEDWSIRPAFDIHPDLTPDSSYLAALFSWSILMFYLPVVAALVGAALLIEKLK